MSLPLPPHYDPERVGAVWRVPYEERAAEAEAWAAAHATRPASDDELRVCLVCVDCQNTFCAPGFELFVAGRSGQAAVDDVDRLCRFLYANLAAITHIVVTLDTHQAAQIFHAVFLVDERGEHPDPFTLVSLADVESGRWRFNPALAEALGIDAGYGAEHLRHYARRLADTGKYELTVWPYHAMLGGIGHALVSSLEEAIFFHTIARRTAVRFETKGFDALTEHYSMLGPEVAEGPDGRRVGSRNRTLVDALLAFDAVLVAGQAKSHCVAWTIDDLIGDLTARGAPATRRLSLLEDCTSPVVVSGVVDYTAAADEAVRRFAEEGLRVVRSTDRVDTWLGR